MVFNNIVVAYDGSDHAVDAVMKARDFALADPEVRIHVVFVTTHPNAQLPASFNNSSFDPEQYLLSVEDVMDANLRIGKCEICLLYTSYLFHYSLRLERSFQAASGNDLLRCSHEKAAAEAAALNSIRTPLMKLFALRSTPLPASLSLIHI